MIKPSIYILLWVFASVLVTEAFNLFPVSDTLYRMYPLNSNVQISLQAWADYGCTRISFSILFFIIFWISDKYSGQLFIIWLMSLVYVIDYFLTYNGKVHIGNVDLRFTIVRVILFIFIIIKTIKEEWT